MVRFAEQLITEIKNIPDSLHILINRLRHEKNVGIWGTGVAGQMVLITARKWGIRINFFVDGSLKNDDGFNLMNTPVISSHSIPSDAFIIIAADVKYGIHDVIEKGCKNTYCYIDPFLFAQYTVDMKEKVIDEIISAQLDINSVYARLKDEKSKRTLHNVLIHRAIHHIELLWEVLEHNQYFGNDLLRSVDGCFIDCGAYTGDTLKAFLTQVNNINFCYYAFEPEQDNYNALKAFVVEKCLSNVHLFQIGLWDKKAYLRFLENDTNDSLAWKLDVCSEKTDQSIPVDSLDNILKGIKTDYIKMDIEGSELKAMEGGRKTIKKWNPQLAISAYHELHHLWRVPQMMLDMNASYRIFYRHHSWNMADTVCYGL